VKWIEVIALTQWFSFARIVYPISVINMNILKVIGRSDLFLKVDLAKFPIVVIAMIITIPLGVKAMVIAQVVTSIIAFFINAYMPGKLFGYGALAQLKDMMPIILATALMALVVFIVTFKLDNNYLKLIFGTISGFVTYSIVANIFKLQELKEVRMLLIKLMKKSFEK